MKLTKKYKAKFVTLIKITVTGGLSLQRKLTAGFVAKFGINQALIFPASKNFSPLEK